MKTKFLMAASVLLVIMAVMYMSARSRLAETVATGVIDLAYLIVLVGGSTCKLSLWWRYRNDPARRKQVVFSTPFPSSGLRRLFYDEKEDGAKKD